MAALQYRASNKVGLPSMYEDICEIYVRYLMSFVFDLRREVKHLLPVSVLKLKSVRPQIWTTTVHEKLYSSVENMTILEAKIKFLSK